MKKAGLKTGFFHAACASTGWRQRPSTLVAARGAGTALEATVAAALATFAVGLVRLGGRLAEGRATFAAAEAACFATTETAFARDTVRSAAVAAAGQPA